MTDEQPRGRTIEDVVAISAGADRVWSILADLPGWSRWNPLVPNASGRLAVGEMLDISVVLPGMKPAPARPEVLAVEPGRMLRYGTTQAGGLMRARRYILIEPQGADRCTVRNGETFSGPLGRLVAMLMGAKIAQGMVAMNAALKRQAEAG